MSKVSLKNLLKGRTIVSGPIKTITSLSYTEAERALARQCALACLIAANIVVSKEKVDTEIVNILPVLVQKMGSKVSLSNLMFSAYRTIEKKKLKLDSTKADFPKTDKNGGRIARDYTSVHVLLRSVLKSLDVDSKQIDTLFKNYHERIASTLRA